MKSDIEPAVVCFPAPLGCFSLPASGPTSVSENREPEDDTEELLLGEPSLAVALRQQAPPGCFFCLVDDLDDE